MKDSSLPYFLAVGLPALTCSDCGTTNAKAPVHPLTTATDEPHLCLRCRVRLQEAVMLPTGSFRLSPDVLDADVDHMVTARMLEIGAAPEEIAADLLRLKPQVAGALKDLLPVMRTGAFPKAGIGLCGTSGTGKSSALAALIRLQVTNNYRTLAPVSAEWTRWADILWISWPATAQRWRLNPLLLTEEMTSRQREMTGVRLLVLDDLARESRKDAEVDRVTSLLDAVVSARDRLQWPTLWTSNLTTKEELGEVYGGSMVRRLTRLNPIAFIPKSTPLF